MESAVLLMFQKTTHIIQHSFAILSFQVCLTELLDIPEENHSRVYTSTSTMHVRTMQGDQLNVFMQKDPADTVPGLQSRPHTKRLVPF
jgi:hypothetical protein